MVALAEITDLWTLGRGTPWIDPEAMLSAVERQCDDLRMLRPALDRTAIEYRLKTSAGALLADEGRRADAEQNWYIVFGDALPT